jgi:hypothetical protein
VAVLLADAVETDHGNQDLKKFGALMPRRAAYGRVFQDWK